MEKSRSRLRYSLHCPGPDGSPHTMSTELKLKGETKDGKTSLKAASGETVVIKGVESQRMASR